MTQITLSETLQRHRVVAVGSMPDASWVSPQAVPADTIRVSSKSLANPNGLDLVVVLIPVDADGDPVALPARTVRLEPHAIHSHDTGLGGPVDVVSAGSRTVPHPAYADIVLHDLGAGVFAIRLATSSGSAGSATHYEIWVREA